MTRKSSLHAVRVLLPLAVAALLAGGCASAGRYSLERYQPAQDRFGVIALPKAKKVYLCPTIDSLPPECRRFLDPKFTPGPYTADAIEQELKASGIQPLTPAFSFGPSFDSLQTVLAEKADPRENAVYLGTELLWLAPGRWSLDAKLLSPAGKPLFEKRGICVIFGGQAVDEQDVTHMVIRQILADPNFKKAIQ